MGEAPSQRQPKIAVIAVHGVADQSPHDSARAIANLLLNPKQTDKQIQYTPFEESTLRIGVRPVIVSQNPPKLEPAPKQNPIRAEQLQNCDQIPDAQPSHAECLTHIENTLDHNGHEFIWKQVHQYKGEGVKSTYETVRLEGSR